MAGTSPLRKMRRHGKFSHQHRKPGHIKLNYLQMLQLEMMQTMFGTVLLKTALAAGKTAKGIKNFVTGGKRY